LIQQEELGQIQENLRQHLCKNI